MITLAGATDAGGFQASVTVDLPEGAADGDRLLLFGTANDSDLVTSLPSGWSALTEDEIGEDVATYVWTRTADSEPADYTVEWEGSHWHFLNALALSGVAGIRSYDITSDDSASTLDAPVLDAQDGDLLVLFGFHWSDTTRAWPGAVTEVSNTGRLISGYQHITEAGPTEPHTLTTGTSGHMAVTAILLTPVEEAETGIAIPLRPRIELQLDPGEWSDITADLRLTDPVTIRRGRSDESGTADASSCDLRLGNPDGRYTPRHPDSPHFGRLRRNTPLRVGILNNADQVLWRFAGEVSEWPIRWEPPGTDATVPITAGGLLRRLSQGEPPERDALRRAIAAGLPLAYWPITQDGLLRVIPSAVEDGLDMTILADPKVSGSVALRSTQLDWQAGDLAPWLDGVARTTGQRGEITGSAAPGSAAGWAVDLARARAGGQDRLIIRTRPDGDGISQHWRMRFFSESDPPFLQATVRLVQDDEGIGSLTTLGTWEETAFFSAQSRWVRLSVVPDGSDAFWTVSVDGEVLDSGVTDAVGTPDEVWSLTYRWEHDDPDDAEHAAVGHITVWDQGTDPPPPSALDLTRAMGGHAGERAGTRIRRVCTEEGLVLRVVGDLEDTPPMGPQQPEAPLQVMRAAEQVDDGVLHEARDEVALVYRTNRSRYWKGGAS